MLSTRKCLCAAAACLLPGWLWGAPVESDGMGRFGDKIEGLREDGMSARIEGDTVHTGERGNEIVFSGKSALLLGDLRMEAERFVYNQQTRRAHTEGEVRLNFDAIRMLVLDAEAHLPEKDTGEWPTLMTGELRMGMPPGYIRADSFFAKMEQGADEATTTRATLKDVTIYYHEPDFFSISVDADTISYAVERRGAAPINPDDVEIHVQSAVMRVAGVPIFYLPSYRQRGLDLPPLQPYVRAGFKNKPGMFLRTTTYFTGLDGYKPGLLLDGNTKAGALVGPALLYDTDAFSWSEVFKGDLQAGWIHDNSDRGLDNYDNPIGADRGFVVWNHKQEMAGRVELTSSFNYWSDTSVLRDFRSQLFDEKQQPDSFLEIVHPGDTYYASVFTRYRPNDFQAVRQRLPELRFDLNPGEIYDTGVYQRFNASFVYLLERQSPEFPVLPGGAAELDSPRFDAYYGWTRPFKFADWLTFTPVAGVRSTTYLDTADDSGTYTRVLPQVGFDLQMLAHGVWDYDNAIWEINGLRHQVRPLVQYRWIPAAEKGLAHIPSIDRYTFTPYPPPLDLSQKRYADDLWEQQVFRIGLENLFQTRAADYGSRELAWLNLYQDFRDTERPGERTLSNTYIHFGVSPAYWLDFEIYNRIDPYSWDSREVTTRLTLHDGDRWRAWLGTQYITDYISTNQFFWGGEYQLNSDYSIRGQWRYDREAGKLTEQFYGLRQRLGHTWTIEYLLGYRKNAREDDNFSFSVSLRMRTF